jgi:hypothetical protein
MSCNYDHAGTILNSKVERIVRTTFSKCGQPKMTFEPPVLIRRPSYFQFEVGAFSLNKDFTPPGPSLEGFFTEQADFATAILFYTDHWRSRLIDTD